MQVDLAGKTVIPALINTHMHLGTNRVWQVSLDGSVSVLAGSGEAGSEDGVGASATFNQPNGIAIANSRDALYGMDVGGEAASIRRVDLGA